MSGDAFWRMIEAGGFFAAEDIEILRREAARYARGLKSPQRRCSLCGPITDARLWHHGCEHHSDRSVN